MTPRPTWLHRLRAGTTPTATPDTPATEAANPRVQGRDGVWAREVVLHADAARAGRDCPVADCPQCTLRAAVTTETPRAAAERPVEALAPHVRVIPRQASTGTSWADWEVVDGAGKVRAGGTGFDEADAARKGAQILEILAEGGITGVTL